MSDEPIEKCPKFDGKVKRLFGKEVGLIFKGSGFYSTDYKRNDSQRRPVAEELNLARNHPVQMVVSVKVDVIILDVINTVKSLGNRLKKIRKMLGG